MKKASLILTLFLMSCTSWSNLEGLDQERLDRDMVECKQETNQRLIGKYGHDDCKNVRTAEQRRQYDEEDVRKYPRHIRNQIYVDSIRNSKRIYKECREMKNKIFDVCMYSHGWEKAME